MGNKTLFEKMFEEARLEAEDAYDDAPTPEEASGAYYERMQQFAREYPRKCHPLRYAARLLAEGTPEDWLAYLGECYITHADDPINLALYLAGEASKETIEHYQEPDGVMYFRFLRGVRGGRYGHDIEDIRFAAKIVLGGLR